MDEPCEELTDEHYEVIDALSRNDGNYNFLKLAEELNELAELCLKRVTKSDTENAPTNQMIIDEIGDVMLRLIPIVELVDPREVLIEKRIKKKMNSLKEKLDAGKYPNRL
jgi:NTP pyrophosphatase (non-canonical NTP hydrolase)